MHVAGGTTARDRAATSQIERFGDVVLGARRKARDFGAHRSVRRASRSARRSHFETGLGDESAGSVRRRHVGRRRGGFARGRHSRRRTAEATFAPRRNRMRRKLPASASMRSPASGSIVPMRNPGRRSVLAMACVNAARGKQVIGNPRLFRRGGGNVRERQRASSDGVTAGHYS